MAEVNANTLPAKTDLGSNDSAIVVDQTTNAGALVDLDVLADKVLDRITSKTFANQVGGSSAATLLAQLSTLNSNFPSTPTTITPTINSNIVQALGANSSVNKQGKIVQLTILVHTADNVSVTSTDVVLSDLPRAVSIVNLMGYTYDNTRVCKAIIDTQGRLRFDYGYTPIAGAWLLFNTVYFTSD